MTSSILLSALALMLIVSENGHSAPQTLKLKDLSGWSIVLGEEAIPSEQYAAEEFQRLFAEVTGTTLPIISKPSAAIRNIFIGPSSAVELTSLRLGERQFGEEELAIRIREDNIAIVGGRPRGTLYGVYEFFERYSGVRFLTHDHTYFPADAAERSIPLEEFTYNPPFLFRWSNYGENLVHPEFAARLRVNTVTREERLGGISSQQLISHTLKNLLPVEKYGKDHPEYFALHRGERRLIMFGGGPEPCVTNPEVIDIVSQAVLDQLDGGWAFKNISVSQNDNDAYCRCEKCEAINQREGTPMGSHLAFVNAVAERVAQQYPDIKVGTLAYWYTRKPPKNLRPRENVQIQLANIECCTLHSINDPRCRLNREFAADLEGWRRLTDEIFIWTYITNFRYYDLPYPNLHAIGPTLKYYRDHGIKGVFMQANGRGTSGDLSDLRNYVVAHLLWNPSLDGWNLVEEFCRLHYGRAAKPILKYLNFFHDHAEALGLHPICFASPKEVGLDPQVAERIFGYFSNALALADNVVIRERVEKASISAHRAMLETNVSFKYVDGKLRRVYTGEHAQIAENYMTLSRKYALTMIDENTPYAKFEEMLQNGIPAAGIENDFWRLTAIPEDNGRVVEMTYKPTGRNFVSAFQRNLKEGTIEDWGAQGYDHDGTPRAFEAKVEGQSLTLTKTLVDGSIYLRKITLPADGSAKVLCETSLTHRGSSPKTYQLIAHPEFDAATSTNDAQILSVYVKQENQWTRVNDDMVNDQGPKADLLRTAKDGAAYAYFNHERRFGLLETYDPTKLERLRIWWSPEFSQINLELLTAAVELKPGETFSFTYTFEYLDKAPQ
ncbi:MAG: DUF4838 domain-containing protein [candidate division KSB1 bacterium]|nr:DUF4838 domain-containing protein [candidate division KSB1 bacterium]MDZ7304734.1 DUF4838 domain-containing protein [candidate division KSB1 bacterium]MDZ7313838.1 DUF4838 domain-containing protein [candidate division KSB1 bacterium]